VVKELVEEGANVHAGIKNGHLEVALHLVKQGANIQHKSIQIYSELLKIGNHMQ